MSVMAPERLAPTHESPILGYTDRSSARFVLRALVITQGAAFVVLVGLSGSTLWRTLRVLAVLAITFGGVLLARRASRLGRGGTALILGISGTVAGAGIGGVYVAKVGVSVLTVAGVVALVTGLWLLVWGAAMLTRATPGWWRLVAVPAGLLIIAFVLFPLTVAVNVTNRPATHLGSATPADRGLAYESVAFRTNDGVRLSAWYVPSGNGAAVVLLHGAGSTRSAVLGHAVVLARHGYGVLLLDARGHGLSEGHAMDFGWYGNLDIAAAVSYLESRPDVQGGSIAAVGMSMGGEQAIAAAGSDPRIRAVVSEGTTGMQQADHGWLAHYGVRGSIQRGIDWVMYQASAVLSGAPRPMSLREAIGMAAPRQVLLIAAGNVADEPIAGRFFQEASPDSVQLWVVPGAGHTEGLATDPAEWEGRVTAFLDRALGS
jgi:pimeloyl-ACP methyl ester carboxylesterase